MCLQDEVKSNRLRIRRVKSWHFSLLLRRSFAFLVLAFFFLSLSLFFFLSLSFLLGLHIDWALLHIPFRWAVHCEGSEASVGVDWLRLVGWCLVSGFCSSSHSAIPQGYCRQHVAVAPTIHWRQRHLELRSLDLPERQRSSVSTGVRNCHKSV